MAGKGSAGAEVPVRSLFSLPATPLLEVAGPAEEVETKEHDKTVDRVFPWLII
jgi:hypothetical protein